MGDEAAERAAALRKQVEDLTSPAGGEGGEPSRPREDESPREFLHRRMAEEREAERHARERGA